VRLRGTIYPGQFNNNYSHRPSNFIPRFNDAGLEIRRLPEVAPRADCTASIDNAGNLAAKLNFAPK
jgi:hypothetical protein